MGYLRRLFNIIFLSDHEWKKKHCSNLHKWLFQLTNEEKHEIIKTAQKNRRVCPDCRGIYFSNECPECPECTEGKPCGGYEIGLESGA